MQRLSSLMQQEMTRKQFLGTVGLLIAAVFGFGNILNFFLKNTHNPSFPAGDLSSSSYGGEAPPRNTSNR